MKRDWELIRQILITVENAEADDRISDNDIGCSEETFHYNAILLSQAGLVQAMILPNLNTTLVESLTWEGHEFLDLIRDESAWQRIKNTAHEKNIAFSFASIQAIEQHFSNAQFLDT
jgi:Hypothetical protein (DUF2513)